MYYLYVHAFLQKQTPPVIISINNKDIIYPGNNGNIWRSGHHADTLGRMPMPTCLDS